MDTTVDVTLPVDAEAAKALDSPARRAAAGRYLSGLLKGRRVPSCSRGSDRRGQARGPRERPDGRGYRAELEAWRAERKA